MFPYDPPENIRKLKFFRGIESIHGEKKGSLMYKSYQIHV